MRFALRKLAHAHFEHKQSHKYQIPVAVPFFEEIRINILAGLEMEFSRYENTEKNLFGVLLVQRILPDSKLEIINDGSRVPSAFPRLFRMGDLEVEDPQQLQISDFPRVSYCKHVF